MESILGQGLGWEWGVKGRPGQPRAPHHEAAIPHTTNPGADDLPHTNAALMHPLTSCHLQQEKRNPDQEQHNDVDDEKTPCAGDSGEALRTICFFSAWAFLGVQAKHVPSQRLPSGPRASGFNYFYIPHSPRCLVP